MLFLIIKVMTVITIAINLLNKLPSYHRQDSGDVMQTFPQQDPSSLLPFAVSWWLDSIDHWTKRKSFCIWKYCASLKKFLFSFPFPNLGLETVPPSHCFFTPVIFICYLIMPVFKLLFSFSFWAYIIIRVLPRGKLTWPLCQILF